jgi:ribosomal protein L18
MVNWSAGGDLVLATVTGSDLVKKFDWPQDFSQKSVPACYLTGFALGKAAMAQGCTDAVLDIGLAGSTPGGRVFSALRVWWMLEWTFLTVMKYFQMKTESTVNIFLTKFLLR